MSIQRQISGAKSDGSKVSRRVFIAGASGVIGRRLCRLLVEDGWDVIGMTRSPEKFSELQAAGVAPAVVDVFDIAALHGAIAVAKAEVIVHQLTDLPDGLDPAKMPEAIERNARIRDIGTRNLIAAAVAAKVKRMVAQSVAFAYAPAPRPYREDSPLNVADSGPAGVSARGVAALERQVLQAPLEGVILRYGKLYGPGTGFDTRPPGGPVHVDAAAHAARLALTRGAPGIYNLAEIDGSVSSDKAIGDLGWNPDFRV